MTNPSPSPIPMPSPSTPISTPGFLNHFARALGLLFLSSGLGLALNHFSNNALSISDAQGPGALPEAAPRISADAYRTLLQAGDLLLLDARAKELLDDGIPLLSMRVTIDTLNSETGYRELRPFLLATPAEKIIVICDSATCTASDLVVQKLTALGHPDIRVFEGGWEAYKNAQLPLRPKRP